MSTSNYAIVIQQLICCVCNQHDVKYIKWVSNHHGKIKGFTKRGHMLSHLTSLIEPVFSLEVFEA